MFNTAGSHAAKQITQAVVCTSKCTRDWGVPFREPISETPRELRLDDKFRATATSHLLWAIPVKTVVPMILVMVQAALDAPRD